MRCLGTTWDLAEFMNPRRPVSFGCLTTDELKTFTQPDAVRVLDMPIKMPDCDEYRLPQALAQFAPVIQRIVDVEHRLLAPSIRAEYHAYLTIDQRWVEPLRSIARLPAMWMVSKARGGIPSV